MLSIRQELVSSIQLGQLFRSKVWDLAWKRQRMRTGKAPNCLLEKQTTDKTLAFYFNAFMPKNTIISIAFISAIIFFIGAYLALFSQKENNLIVEQHSIKQNVPSKINDTREEEKKDIRDLLDGNYILSSVDMENWQVYQNKEAGFEVKIPKDWFCGRIALELDTKRGVACFPKEDLDAYYAGTLREDNIVMINLPDLEKIYQSTFKERLLSQKKLVQRFIVLV
ncbi:MAG: hypothetical protein IPL87_02575 [Candidatus Moraniibacteriota bacterium]|nr:MAG: hypothetical protein IPL87_02575 [Candidatus Moranbacteria bacterium]